MQKSVGQLLVEQGVISDDALAQAMASQQDGASERLDQTLVKMKLASEDDVLKAMGAQMGVGFARN